MSDIPTDGDRAMIVEDIHCDAPCDNPKYVPDGEHCDFCGHPHCVLPKISPAPTCRPRSRLIGVVTV